MTEQNANWKQVTKNEIRQRRYAEQSLEEMRMSLFDYFYLLGPDPKANMSIVVDTLGKVFGSTVAMYNRMDSGLLKTWCIDPEPEGFKREDSPEGHICYNMTIRRRGVANMAPVVLEDLEGTKWETLDPKVCEYGLKSYLGCPILLEGEVVGSLCVADTQKRRYSEVELYSIKAFACAICLEEERLLTLNRMASANESLKRKNKEIEALALTDSLTGLPNRRAMIDSLNKEIANLHRQLFDDGHGTKDVKGFAIAMCDIDFFKTVNDTYGHNFGDDVLKTVSKTLQNAIRPQDKISRWGGEEFLILFRDLVASDAALIAAERLRKAIAGIPFSHDGQSFQVTMSIGVSTCNSKNMDLDRFVQAADAALYESKETGRNRVVINRDSVNAFNFTRKTSYL